MVEILFLQLQHKTLISEPFCDALFIMEIKTTRMNQKHQNQSDQYISQLSPKFGKYNLLPRTNFAILIHKFFRIYEPRELFKLFAITFPYNHINFRANMLIYPE